MRRPMLGYERLYAALVAAGHLEFKRREWEPYLDSALRYRAKRDRRRMTVRTQDNATIRVVLRRRAA